MKKILLTIGILLTLFVTPLHAAVEFMPLKEIRISGYPVHTSSSDNGDIYIVDSINRKLLVYNDNYKLMSTTSGDDKNCLTYSKSYELRGDFKDGKKYIAIDCSLNLNY